MLKWCFQRGIQNMVALLCKWNISFSPSFCCKNIAFLWLKLFFMFPFKFILRWTQTEYILESSSHKTLKFHSVFTEFLWRVELFYLWFDNWVLMVTEICSFKWWRHINLWSSRSFLLFLRCLILLMTVYLIIRNDSISPLVNTSKGVETQTDRTA
jgi:hypothetical protein